MKKNPHKKYSLYNPDNGSVARIKATYLEEGHTPTICGEHIVLANLVDELITDNPEIRRRLLEKIDIVYDMGKRMGMKLVEYHNASGKGGGWREGY